MKDHNTKLINGVLEFLGHDITTIDQIAEEAILDEIEGEYE